ncbi:hypothetical protein EIP86_001277 [Pleurotus ostreatoroseus]|nr:hypothetical protein EIP86_001277 [Pleurotus ostreatoroseus]
MGVQGLWEILQVTSQSRALAHLAVVDGFENNVSGRRAFRVGIDASLWKLPILPLFVFDGRQRPKVKRGSKKGKSGSHNLTQKMKEMLDFFGMEWRMALGEAEAELAYLNRAGVIDAIMTDDADAFLFGAKTIIRNPSLQLTGNRSDPAVNLDGNPSQNHVKIFSADAIRNHPQVRLTRGGMILIALLAGGDYDHVSAYATAVTRSNIIVIMKGIMNCGPATAHALALCGFGDQLLDAYQHGVGHFKAYLPVWRNAVNEELRTNSQGRFTRLPGIRISDTFPDLAVMDAYANPVCSGRADQEAFNAVHLRDKGDLSLSQAAGFCEAHFDEWGYRSMIVKRFRDLLWNAAVVSVLRRAALEADEKEKNKRSARGELDLHLRGPLTPAISDAVGTPTSLVTKYLSPAVSDPYADIFVNRGTLPEAATSAADPYPLIKDIVSERRHVSTDRLLEYRVVINPRQLVDLTQKGIKGKHPEPSAAPNQDLPDIDGFYPASEAHRPRTPKKPPPEPYSVQRLWLPASIMRQVHPGLVQRYEREKAEKAARKAGGGRRRGQRANSIDTSEESDSDVPLSSPIRSQRPSRRRTSPTLDEPPPYPSGSRVPRRTTNPRQASAEIIEISSPRPSRAPTPIAPRRFYNVGLIDDELPASDRAFLFTFTNPDDPDMTVWDHDDIDMLHNPGLSVTDSNLPGTPRTVPPQPSTRQKGKQREVPAPVDDEDDEWGLPPLPPSQLDQYDDMFDRILGIPPKSKPTGATTRTKTKTSRPATTRGRPRTQTSPSATNTPRPSADSGGPSTRAPRAPAPRRRVARPRTPPATVHAEDDDDDDDDDLPSLPPSQLDQYTDMFDRILGIAPSQSKTKAKASRTNAKAKAKATPRKRPRAGVTVNNADAPTKPAQNKRRRTAGAAASSSLVVHPPQTPPRPSTVIPRRNLQPFPDIPSHASHHDDNLILDHPTPNLPRPKPRPVTISTQREPIYPSSSQESELANFFADVTIIKDLS